MRDQRYSFALVLAVVLVACSGAGSFGPSGSDGRASAPVSSSANAGSAPPSVKPEWQAKWDETVAAAKQEGRVVVYGPSGDVVRRNMIDGFRKAFPDITLEWFGSRMAEVTGKIEAERRGGVYSIDVLIGGTSTANLQMKPIGALDPLRPVLMLPEVTDPTLWLDNRLDFSDRDEMNLVFAALPIPVLLYDPKQVRLEEVDELYELLAPKWQGKIVVSDPIPQGAGQASARWIWEMLGPEKGAEYIRALRLQAGAVDRDLRRQAEWIARGRYAILVAPGSGSWQRLRQEGLTFGVVVEFKDYGTHVTPGTGTVMLVNRAPHPNAATVFINWVLSKEGQLAYSTGLEQPSRRLDVPTDHLPDEVRIRPGGKYWAGYTEEDIVVPAALEALLREQFSR